MTPLPQTPNGATSINLALQGGGSHGAFTWGVLDALLEDGRLGFEGISGTSAGAMNAVALAHGFAQAEHRARSDAREAARESLKAFWDGIVAMGALGSTLSEAQRAPFSFLFGPCMADNSPAAVWMNAMSSFWSSTVSPYQANPFDINPLRNFVERNIDFEAIARAHGPKVFVVATRVRSGKAEVFSGHRLTVDAVMASACLPTLFKAVEIEGDHFWDGGYSGNPAIHPLIYECQGRDIVLVQINPIRRDELPTTSAQIMDRVNEVTFNAGLVAEMRAIDFVKRLIADGKLDPAHYKDVLMHRIDGGAALDAFAASTKSSTDASLIQSLHQLGREHAKQWLHRHFDLLGVRSSINIKQDYLDDMRVPVKG
ncbi:patatin-like phospholipase family protein [Roseateles koreensis]|uniref:Patatin-like phospholipase family protein n=1 Tax=Roseateles koreensis TaxID=2987526 RepID=A0ABT5KRM9_9BURK|nr:patatin-like phospholipase family protein [Roseateles koreensis]MDC8785568.1 patatin-like phospholipase family protein [Roseateles koreensis]